MIVELCPACEGAMITTDILSPQMVMRRKSCSKCGRVWDTLEERENVTFDPDDWYQFGKESPGEAFGYDGMENTIQEVGEWKEIVRLKQVKLARHRKRQIYWSEVRKAVLERDNYTCQKCGKVGKGRFHIHHILKRRKGGTDHMDNLITVCPVCHKAVDSKEYNPTWE